MGRNKAKGQKQKNVFHVANKKITKAKSKAKPVTTSLKKINIVNDEKVSMVNKVFTEVQKEVKQLSKAIPSDSSKRNQIPKPLESEPANVDAAANLLSQFVVSTSTSHSLVYQQSNSLYSFYLKKSC